MACSHISDIGYGHFSKRIHSQSSERGLPLDGTLELTTRCNLDCAHCYINSPVGDKQCIKSELSGKEWCGFIDQIVAEGGLWILLTGGEPLLHPDFVEIYQYAKRSGLLVTIFTNGTFINERMADMLMEWPPFVVEITLYGHTESVYEKVTGVAGSFKKCRQAVDLLLEREIPLKLKTVVMKENAHELSAMQNYAELLGLEFRYDVELNMGIDDRVKPTLQRLSTEEVVQYDLDSKKRLSEWKKLYDWSLKLEKSNLLYKCGAGKGTFHIDAYGRMMICMMVREPFYDLKNGSFKNGWYDFFPKVLAQKENPQSVCSSCELIDLCGQCPGLAQLESGDSSAQIKYYCEIAHTRAKALGYVRDKGL